MSKVLVTGGTGFVGSYCLIQLLKQNYELRTTIRSLKREPEVREILKASGVEDQSRITFFPADLTKDDGWADAVAGCDFVLHVASPFPWGPVKNENELIIPAREGTLRVLKAARDANVQRVVITSSFGAVGYGYPEMDRTFTESDWTNTSGPLPAYIKSKTIAEKAAWDFVKNEGGKLELTVICPTGIFGPALSADLSTSIEIVRSMLKGQMPRCPKIYFGAVDVRDVAALHVLAMTESKAAGQRFIATSGSIYSLLEVARDLRKNLGDQAKLVPSRELPSWLVRILAKFIPRLRGVAPDLERKRHPSDKKIVEIFGYKFLPIEESITDTGKSLIALGLIG